MKKLLLVVIICLLLIVPVIAADSTSNAKVSLEKDKLIKSDKISVNISDDQVYLSTDKIAVTSKILVNNKEFVPSKSSKKSDSLKIEDSDTSISYDLSGNKLKETIVLQKDMDLSFPISVSEGYTLIPWYNGEYKIVEDSLQNTISGIVIKKPFGYDANGYYIPMYYIKNANALNLVYDKTITKYYENNTYEIIPISYPIVIDPTWDYVSGHYISYVDGYTIELFNTTGVLLNYTPNVKTTTIEYLLVGGGGGGGAASGAGGGGGGNVTINTSFSVGFLEFYNITVGYGGVGATSTNLPENGQSGGTTYFGSDFASGGSGGIGGGGTNGGNSGRNISLQSTIYTGGIGNAIRFAGGGAGSNMSGYSAAGTAGNGGDGVMSNIATDLAYYGGGGGGGQHYAPGDGTTPILGGLGGGGNGGNSSPAGFGIDGLGGGGGGGGGVSGAAGQAGANGGSGAVIIKYINTTNIFNAFIYTPTNGTTPLKVQFNITQNLINVDNISWFMDSTWYNFSAPFTDDINVSHTFVYTTPETYNRTINLTTSNLVFTNTTSVNISVFPKFDADFTATPLIGVSGTLTTFTSTETYNASDFTDIKYNWSFGDYSYEDLGAVVTHAYAYYGTFDVNLTVTANRTCDNATIVNFTKKDSYITITSSALSAWYSPHQVTFTVMNNYGVPQPNLTINATFIVSTFPDQSWLNTIYGVPATTAAQMMSNNLSMVGNTRTDGSVTFTMHASLAYGVNVTGNISGVDIVPFYVELQPSDNDYTLWLRYLASNVSWIAISPNATLTMYQPNISWATFGVDYYDVYGLTTLLEFELRCQNNNTVVYATSIDPGISRVLLNTTIPNIRGQRWIWKYNAVRV